MSASSKVKSLRLDLYKSGLSYQTVFVIKQGGIRKNNAFLFLYAITLMGVTKEVVSRFYLHYTGF